MNASALLPPVFLAGLIGGCASNRGATKDLILAGMLAVLFYLIGRFVKLIDKL